MRVYQIKPCHANDFIDILREFQSFNETRKKGLQINNTPRLIDLIKKYFQAYLYYIDHKKSKMIVEINNKLFQSEISGFDKEGNLQKLEITEIYESLLKDIFGYIATNINIDQYNELIELLNAILLNHNISIEVKISVINSENNYFDNKWHFLTRELPYDLAKDTIKIRKNLLIKILSENLIIETNFNTKEEYDSVIKSIYKLYEFYSLTYFKMLIAKSHFTDIQTYIQSELKKITKINGIDQNKLITFLLRRSVMYNNLFLGMDKDSLSELIEEYEDYVESTDLEQINNDLEFDPNNFELGNVSIRLHEPDFSKFDENEIETILQFVVPYKIQEEKRLKLKENVDLFFNSITSLFQDPIFSFYDEIDISISGMPVSFFSDTIGNLQSSTLITIKIPYFYHPQFDIVDKKYVEKDLKLEAAKRGGKYYPHKDIIIEKLFESYTLDDFPLDIEEEKITSEFISNYMVSYFTTYGERIHHEVFTITNFNSYFKAKNRYIQELNKFLMDDDLVHIKKFFHESKIIKPRDFLDFCYKFLELTIKKSIEFGGLNNNFWDNDSPILEPKAQPIIFNTIRYLAEIKGIQISRETVASNGSLDFHFSYNTGEELLKVCVELKNAHHGSLLHGINTQLPLYIKDVGRKEGIFLVLWYKSEKFNEPTKYKNIEELKIDLVKEIPRAFKIKPLIIDCTPKISPSKKGSKDRLK